VFLQAETKDQLARTPGTLDQSLRRCSRLLSGRPTGNQLQNSPGALGQSLHARGEEIKVEQEETETEQGRQDRASGTMLACEEIAGRKIELQWQQKQAGGGLLQ
jgi:hypothetical protein